ncbi:hypothetical protein ACWD4T_02695 [Streptomyces umbrinus]
MSTTAGTNTGASKPGPSLGPIAKTVGAPHRAWLEVMRTAYFDSGLSTEEISEKSRCAEGVKRLTSKGKVSELLRGTEEYPRWYRVLALYEVLSPSEPLRAIKEMWVKGALEAGRSVAWVNKCFADVRRDAGTSDEPPIRLGPDMKPTPLKERMFIAAISAALFLGFGLTLWGMGFLMSTGSAGQPHANVPDPRTSTGYLDLPTPTKTQDLLKVTPHRDIRVYSRVYSWSHSFASEGKIKAEGTFFVKCRTDSALLMIAGTRYYVDAGRVILVGDTSRRDIEDLPQCAAVPDTSPSTR